MRRAAVLGRGRELRRLVSIVGEQALSDDDRRTLAFVDEFGFAWELLTRYHDASSSPNR